MNLEVVADRNNRGVAYLEAGDLRQALEYFSEALKYIMGDLGHQRRQQDPTVAAAPAALQRSGSAVEEVKTVTLPDAPPRPSSPQPFSDHPKPRSCSDPTKALPTSIPFAYARGINLIPCPSVYSPDLLINTTIISSIIIFNLSIIYHLKGLEGNGMCVMRLRKAKTLYQKSHHLLMDAGVPMSSTGNPVIDMLTMALFNNMAHVSYEMGRYDDSRRYFDHLIRFALTVVPARYGDAYVGNLLDQQKSNFLLNAIILQAPKLAAAA